MNDTEIRLECLRLALGDIPRAADLYDFVVKAKAPSKEDLLTAEEARQRHRHAAEADAIVDEMKA